VKGTVYLIGAGPGAPDLLTLRAARLLADADVVFHDALVHPEVIALAERAQKFAVGKRCGRFATAQRFISKRLVDAAACFEVVVRLKGGDPMLFGRAEEELAALRAAGVPSEVVPGISAAFAASAELGVSLTQRGKARSVVFATPSVGEAESASDWVAPVLAADTAALYMAGERIRDVARALLARGASPDTPVAIVLSASLPEASARVRRLGELEPLEPERCRGPVLVLLGEVFAPRAAVESCRARIQAGTRAGVAPRPAAAAPSPFGEAKRFTSQRSSESAPAPPTISCTSSAM
jgi:uroporphyrin-III C-methyltransferase